MDGFYKAARRLLLFCVTGVLLLTPSGAAKGSTAVQGEINFTLLHTNDEHSSAIPHSPAVDYHPTLDNPAVGGFPRLATVLGEIRSEKQSVGEPVLLVSGGDFIGGTAFSWLAPRGLSMELDIMQYLGYDAVTIGNHEYDYGTDVLTQYLQQAGYPAAHDQTAVLAANTLIHPEHPMAQQDLYREYHLVRLENGFTVGFFGIIGRDAVSVTSDPDPFTFEELEETAARAVLELREQGADIVVVLSHSGEDEDELLARAVPGIDLIVGGHSHTALMEPILVEDTIIVQAGAYLQYLGRLELAYRPDTGRLRLRNADNGQPYLIPLDSSIPSDPDMAALVEEYTDHLNDLIVEMTNGQFRHILDTVARADFPLTHTPPLAESTFGNFVTDAMRLVTWEKTGRRVDVAIQANGSIRGSLFPGTLEHARGNISFYDLTTLISLGYGADGYAGYPIVSFYLTGEEIRRALEVAVLMADMMGDTYFLQFSGLRYSYNPQDAVLFTIPIMDTPLPSTRAVKRAELYQGEGIQPVDDNGYEKLVRGDQRLYHIVSDSYILSFLPLAGRLLPQLDIVPKDEAGNPVSMENFDELVVYDNGHELKVWQTVVEYAAAQPLGVDGISRIPDIYRHKTGRINPVLRIPLLIWVILLLSAAVLAVFLLVRQIKRRQSKRKGPRGQTGQDK